MKIEFRAAPAKRLPFFLPMWYKWRMNVRKRTRFIIFAIMALAVLAVIGGVIFGIGVRKPGALHPDTPEYAAAFPDFVLPAEEPIAPEENALTYFVQAVDAVVSIGNDEQGKPIRFNMFFEENRTNLAAIAEVLADNEQVFQLVRQGVQCRRSVYTESEFYEKPSYEIAFPFDIHTLFSARIKYAQDRGDIENALQDIQTLLAYGRLIRQNAPFFYMNSGQVIELVGVLRIMELSRDPQLSERQLKRLLEMLDEIPSYADSLRNAYKFEFTIGTKSLDMIASGNRGLKISSVLGMSFEHISYYEKFAFRYKFIPGETQMQMADAYRLKIAEIDKTYADTIRPVIKYSSGSIFNMIFNIIQWITYYFELNRVILYST